jgi:hypothetical protein
MTEENCNAKPQPTKKPFAWHIWLTIAVLIIILAGLPPLITKSKPKADTYEALSNLRQIGLVLTEFEYEFGEYPNENTAQLVTKKYPQHGYELRGNSSNALFRQLFAAELIQTEEIFYAKVKSATKPDGDISPGELLKKGEVAFGFITGLSTKGDPARPIAFCPIIPGTERFDPKPFDGKAIILRLDCSVTSVNVDKNGHVLHLGKNILSPDHPIWNGKSFDIRYPE